MHVIIIALPLRHRSESRRRRDGRHSIKYGITCLLRLLRLLHLPPPASASPPPPPPPPSLLHHEKAHGRGRDNTTLGEAAQLLRATELKKKPISRAAYV